MAGCAGAFLATNWVLGREPRKSALRCARGRIQMTIRNVANALAGHANSERLDAELRLSPSAPD